MLSGNRIIIVLVLFTLFLSSVAHTFSGKIYPCSPLKKKIMQLITKLFPLVDSILFKANTNISNYLNTSNYLATSGCYCKFRRKSYFQSCT
jgi:hypothetical protein